MRIDGVNFTNGLQLPRHIASAYGVRAASPAPSGAPGAPFRIHQPPAGPQQLIAGRVKGQVAFDGAQTAPARTDERPPVLHLYTRAADRVEAAIGVELGRRLDVEG